MSSRSLCAHRATYFPAENLTEYKWPADDTGEYYMLQEQVSEYLGVTSFKRKYPGECVMQVLDLNETNLGKKIG